MAVLVFFTALLGLTLARPQGYHLPSGLPYPHGRENVIPFASPIRIHYPTGVPSSVPIKVGIPEDDRVKAHTEDGAATGIKSHLKRMNIAEDENVQAVSNEHKILTPANTVLSADARPYVPRHLVLKNGFQLSSLNPQQNVPSSNGEAESTKIKRQVFGSPVWDRKVVDWAAKDCPHLPIIGGAVGGASGGPIGVALGVIGAAIGSCNFNK